MALLSKVHKPDNFESYNPLKLSLTITELFNSNSDRYESFLTANFPDILTYFMAPFLWMGFNCFKTRATSRRQFIFITKCPKIPGTHFTTSDERPSRPWSHAAVLNMGSLDWEFSALTNRSLLHLFLLYHSAHWGINFPSNHLSPSILPIPP